MSSDLETWEKGTLEMETLTVTISIDNDSPDSPAAKTNGRLTDYYHIRPPPKPIEACPHPPPTAKIQDLTVHGRDILSARLNTSAIGSMKNWEHLVDYLAVDIPNSLSSSWKHVENPVEKLLDYLGKMGFTLQKLIQAIGDIGRIDVLLCIKPYICGIKEGMRALENKDANGDSAMFNTMDDSFGSMGRPFQMPRQQFIIVTSHFDKINNKKDYKLFKMFDKNVRKHAANYNKLILHVNECLDDSNIFATLSSLFERCEQVVLFGSDVYFREVASLECAPNASQMLSVKRALHSHMNGEYHHNSQRNLRFRYISTADCVQKPTGWPRNTTCYVFPDHYDKLCMRLFESGAAKANN